MIHRDDEMALLNAVLRVDISADVTSCGGLPRLVSALPWCPGCSGFHRPQLSWPSRRARRRRKHDLHGSITWALESDPSQSHPLRRSLHVQHVGQGVHVRLPARMGQGPEDQPALAESCEVSPGRQELDLPPSPGREVSRRQGADGEDVKYSFELAKPPPPGHRGRLTGEHRQRRGGRRLHRHADHVDGPDRPFPAWWPGRATRRSCRKAAATGSTASARASAPGRSSWSSTSRTTTSSTPATPTTGSRGSPASRDLTLKVLPDEQSRVAALRSGEIDGGTLTADVARTLENDESLQVLEGLSRRAAGHSVQHHRPRRAVAGRAGPAGDQPGDRPPGDHRQRVRRRRRADRRRFRPGYGDWPLPEESCEEFYTPTISSRQGS